MANLRNVATWIDTLSEKVKAKLVADQIFAAPLVYLSLDEDMPENHPSDQFAVIVLGPQAPIMPIIRGADKIESTPFVGQIAVIVFSRLAVDQSERSDQWLNHATLGAAQKLRLVIASLQLYDPVNDDDDFLLIEPMRMAAAGINFPKRPRVQPGWGSTTVVFEIKYQADMALPE